MPGLLGLAVGAVQNEVKEIHFVNDFKNTHPDIINALDKATSIEEIISVAEKQSNKAIEDFYTNVNKDEYLFRGCLKYRYIYLDCLLKQYYKYSLEGDKKALDKARVDQANLFMDDFNKRFNTNLDFNFVVPKGLFGIKSIENIPNYYTAIIKIADYFKKRIEPENVALTYSAVVRIYKEYIDNILYKTTPSLF